MRYARIKTGFHSLGRKYFFEADKFVYSMTGQEHEHFMPPFSSSNSFSYFAGFFSSQVHFTPYEEMAEKGDYVSETRWKVDAGSNTGVLFVKVASISWNHGYCGTNSKQNFGATILVVSPSSANGSHRGEPLTPSMCNLQTTGWYHLNFSFHTHTKICENMVETRGSHE